MLVRCLALGAVVLTAVLVAPSSASATTVDTLSPTFIGPTDATLNGNFNLTDARKCGFEVNDVFGYLIACSGSGGSLSYHDTDLQPVTNYTYYAVAYEPDGSCCHVQGANVSFRTPPTVVDTTITGGPGAQTTDTTPTWTYDSTDSGHLGFECSLDGGGFGSCDGGSFTAPPLSPGAHSLAVRGVYSQYDTRIEDTTPATSSTTVVAPPPGAGTSAAPTGSVAAAIKRCKRKYPKGTRARKHCIRKARQMA